MEISNSLLVAIMFVLILSLGIANIVAALASLVGRTPTIKVDPLHVNWTLILLLIYLNLFWHTTDLLVIEQWAFAGFLYIVAGAILIFFATSVLVPEASLGDTDLRAHYFQVSRRFFSLLALLQVWIIGADLILTGEMTTAGIGNAVALGLIVVLASTQQLRVHVAGTAVTWVLYVAAMSLRSAGVFE